MIAPQPIPYQGSKRTLAPTILRYFPEEVHRLIEPFAGSAAICTAAAMRKKAASFLINDINTPLVNLLKEIIQRPEFIYEQYEKLWNSQLGKEKEFFVEQRALFNQSKDPHIFLYVLARCIKGAVRYNSDGEFNQSADNRRKGKSPEKMKRDIKLMSSLLKGRTEFYSLDYSQIFQMATKQDLVYMDPPYQGTSGTKDHRYISGLQFDEFVMQLELLNEKGIAYMISYDGKTGDKVYGVELPSHLHLHKILIEAGRSTQSTLLGKKEVTFEALYLSKALIEKLPQRAPDEIFKSTQLELI